ncbi:MAG: hypothetical protein PVJ52_02900 [Candidatus Woesebacteria bacterium]|jgi:hypothetical protein
MSGKAKKGTFGVQLKLTNKPKEQLDKLPFSRLVVASVIFNPFIILVVILLQNFLPPQVPLYYGLARSEAQLTSSLGMVIPSIVAISILVVNTALALLVRSSFLKKILIASALSTTLLTTITTIKIISLVISY